MQNDNPEFYSELPVNEIQLRKLFNRPHLFYDIPADWHVVITDVVHSTEAIEAGRHHDINIIATASIVAMMNVVYAENLDVPFFFGGDGATFIVPPKVLAKGLNALRIHSENVKKEFMLDLRVGEVLVSDIYSKGYHLKISKLRSTKTLQIPVILGEGIEYAEKIVKGDDYMPGDIEETNVKLDLEGMSCRWAEIEPRQEHEEVVSLLVLACSEEKQAEVFSKVIKCLDDIYGNSEERKAVTVSRMQLFASFRNIRKEVKLRMKKSYLFLTLGEMVRTTIGKFYFKTRKGIAYLNSLVEMTDDLVLDGRINTVISGTKKQRNKLEAELDKLEATGDILFGLHASNSSVMSCYVRDMELKHIHFIDGFDGGFTRAAVVLKGKMKEVERS